MEFNKPVTNTSGLVYDAFSNRSDMSYKFALQPESSTTLFAGTPEFEKFPLRQMFIMNHSQLPNEWDNIYLHYDFIEKFKSKNQDSLIACHYLKDHQISACCFRVGFDIYVYFYNRGSHWSKDKFGVCILFLEKNETVNELIDEINSEILPEEKKVDSGFLNILIKNTQGLSLESIKIDCPEIDFDINYNEGLKDLNESIISRLNEKDGKGLFLFHGIPGSGKTTYIRYLINQIKKKVIYIPPNLTNCLSDPDFITFFIKNANSVIIIEDAENILTKRSEGSNQAISNILNISDGLLGDCIKIQIIATFNTDLSNIDDALLRKGRLVAKYEFNELSEDRALKLSKKLGVDIPRTHKLADIYNHSEQSFVKEKKRIGF